MFFACLQFFHTGKEKEGIMYTIGQVAKFLGISRDTIKYYEEKELVKPQQNSENGYRTYNQLDIYNLTTVNFYRELDLEIKRIQEVRKGMSIEEIQRLLEEKEQQVLEELAYKKTAVKKTPKCSRRLPKNSTIFRYLYDKRNETSSHVRSNRPLYSL